MGGYSCTGVGGGGIWVVLLYRHPPACLPGSIIAIHDKILQSLSPNKSRICIHMDITWHHKTMTSYSS